MPHYDELYPGRFLKATTLEAPRTIEIVSLGGERLAGDDGEKAKGILRYRTPDGGGGEMVFCKTNAALTAAVLGTDDYTSWAGRVVTIWNDPDVKMGAERVGGIRVMGSPELKAPKTVQIKRPRRKKPDTYVLQPTDAQGRVRQPGAVTVPPVRKTPIEEARAALATADTGDKLDNLEVKVQNSPKLTAEEKGALTTEISAARERLAPEAQS